MKKKCNCRKIQIFVISSIKQRKKKLKKYLLVFLRTICEQDTLCLHVSVQNPLQGGHVTLDHVLHLDDKKKNTQLSQPSSNCLHVKRLKEMVLRVTFSGSWASTSFFSRRSRKGLSTLCKRRMIRMVSSSFRSTCWAAKQD